MMPLSCTILQLQELRSPPYKHSEQGSHNIIITHRITPTHIHNNLPPTLRLGKEDQAIHNQQIFK